MTKTPMLPDRTHPWEGPIERRHAPDAKRAVRYQNYRYCLRWEFGFSCAFCLCHEADLMPGGTEPHGVTSAEHRFTQHDFPELSKDYSNCAYACGRCNNHRRSRPHEDDSGRTLLHPCETDWNERFELIDFELLPRKADDDDATYTLEAYDLNAPDKVRRRRLRHKAMTERVDRSRKLREVELWLLDKAYLGVDYIDEAEKIARLWRDASEDLLQFRAIPAYDAPTSCRCKDPELLTLPEVLAKQTWNLADLWG